jgi:hypothetical protein
MYATEYRVRAPAAPAPQTASEAAPLAHVVEQSLLGDFTSGSTRSVLRLTEKKRGGKKKQCVGVWVCCML